MERRTFMGLMVGGVIAEAAFRTFPFRVYSFPSELKLPDHSIEVYQSIPDDLAKLCRLAAGGLDFGTAVGRSAAMNAKTEADVLAMLYD